VGLAVFSGQYDTRRSAFSPDATAFRFLILRRGVLQFGQRDDPDGMFRGMRAEWTMGREHAWTWEIPSRDFWNGAPWHAGLICHRDHNGWIAGLSLLYPCVLTAVSAALLWYADRRFRGCHCSNCGYDRRGLGADAKCPECGAAAGQARGREGERGDISGA
jgi:hypothetical protein